MFFVSDETSQQTLPSGTEQVHGVVGSETQSEPQPSASSPMDISETEHIPSGATKSLNVQPSEESTGNVRQMAKEQCEQDIPQSIE